MTARVKVHPDGLVSVGNAVTEQLARLTDTYVTLVDEGLFAFVGWEDFAMDAVYDTYVRAVRRSFDTALSALNDLDEGIQKATGGYLDSDAQAAASMPHTRKARA